YNRGIDSHFHQELEPEPESAKPKLKPMLHLSNKEFKEKFGYMSGSWRGKKPLQRNALIAIGHYKDKRAIDDLIKVMNNDPRPVIRGTAAWSLGKIGSQQAYDAIETAMKKETDSQVLFEMEKGLSFQKQT
ncbi:epoxyqueuosine reductase, partial [Halorubrum sp. Hd13]